jgi:hypothetical protein
MLGFCTSTRVRATNCRWPIDRRLPRSPTSLAIPSGSVSSHSLADLARRSLDVFVGGLRAGVADVVGHRAGEEERHLRDDAQSAAIGCQVRPRMSSPSMQISPSWNS